MRHEVRFLIRTFVVLCALTAAGTLAAAPEDRQHCAMPIATVSALLILIQAAGMKGAEVRRGRQDRFPLGMDTSERRQDLYREKLLLLTNDKLEICNHPALQPYLVSAQVERSLDTPEDVRTARREVRDYCLQRGMHGDRAILLTLALGEAANNAIKHAAAGRLLAGRVDDQVWVAVIDHGSGIDPHILPRVALQRGFSTEASLGMGYTVMLDVADRVLLATGSQGTSVVLLQHIDDHHSLDDLRDTATRPPR